MQSVWRRGLIFFALAFLAGLVMVTSESLWIDEGQTLLFARQPTLRAWFDTLLQNTKSEAQMPLGMFVAWLGGQILGLGEWQLRAVNLLWVGLAGTAIGLTARLLKQPSLLWIFLVHPFLWFYANEARPYALQICASTWLLYVLARAYANARLSPGDLWVFSLAAVGGFGSSLLFGFGMLGVFVAAWLLRQQGRLQGRWMIWHWLPIGVTLMGLGVIAAYYLYTLSRGASGAKIWKLSPLNLAFSAYEILGFSGLGPPRNELRELARNPGQLWRALSQVRLLLGLGTLTLLYSIAAARLWKLRRDPLVHWVVAAILAVCLSLYAAAAVVRFPFWGRHLAPLLPFVVVLVGMAASSLRQVEPGVRQYAPSVWLVPLVGCLAVSSLVGRFSADYHKDDYRTASRLALRALDAGKVVWWSADTEECAAYYGLTLERVSARGAQLVFSRLPSSKDLAQWPVPDVVFQSKPDVHDPDGLLQRYLEKFQYRPTRRLPAFSIWTRQGAGLEPLVTEKAETQQPASPVLR